MNRFLNFSGYVQAINENTAPVQPADVKAFQTWLDKNKAGWLAGKSYKTLDQKPERGFGKYGPLTQKAWAAHKDEYTKTLAGTAGTSGTAGTAGTTGTASTAGTTGTAGTASTAGTTGTAGTAGAAAPAKPAATTAGTAGTAGVVKKEPTAQERIAQAKADIKSARQDKREDRQENRQAKKAERLEGRADRLKAKADSLQKESRVWNFADFQRLKRS